MTGLDSNILVQLAVADHEANRRTIAAVERENQQGNNLGLPSLVIAEFLHVVTDERRIVPPLTITVAVGWVEDFLRNPAVHLLEPNEASMTQMLLWMRQFNLGRKRILDTQLAAILQVNGVRRILTSNRGDFTVFDCFEIITP